jgi:sugar/nucleoside kinase (ribokinase family)
MNTVVALRRLNVNVGWLGALGNDFFSRFVAEWSEGENVNLSRIRRLEYPLRRVTVSLSYTDDRAFVTYVDPPPDTIARVLDTLDMIYIKHLHFTGLLIDERTPALLRACHERGIRVSMDCQHREQTLDSPLVREIISHLDLFMPNRAEAQKLTHTTSLHEAATLLQAMVPYLVIKDGVNGAHAWKDGDHMHQPPITVTPVDTTGAGDVFNAGFLAAHLQGLAPAECLRWGNIAGGLSTQGYGGCSTAPTRAEVETFLKE